MNREEILAASRKQNTGMDEKAHSDYQLAYLFGAAGSICVASVFMIAEAFRGGNSYGYTSIVMAHLGISGLIFGLKAKESSLGKLYLVGGITGLLAFVINFILFFCEMFV